MQYRTLGRTGWKVSAIGLGAWAIGGPFRSKNQVLGWGQVDDSESIRAISRARDRGVNFFDTADIYGLGHSEELLGKALRGSWDGCHLATKVGRVMLSDGTFTQDFSPKRIPQACEASLRRLKKETLDLFQLHNPSLEVIQSGEIFEALDDLKAAGKICYYGVSIGTEEEALAVLSDGRAATLQVRYNLLQQAMAERVLPLALERNVGIIARVPLEFGLLSGKFTPDTRFAANDHRSERYPKQVLTKEMAKVDKLRFLADGRKGKPAQAALRFVLSNPAVGTTIPGAKTPAQVEENCEAGDGQLLEPQEISRIRELYAQNFGI